MESPSCELRPIVSAKTILNPPVNSVERAIAGGALCHDDRIWPQGLRSIK